MQKVEMAYAARRHSQDMEKVNEAMRNSVPLTNRILMQIIKEEKKSKPSAHTTAMQSGQGRYQLIHEVVHLKKLALPLLSHCRVT